MKRKIIRIDQEKCSGCGLCVTGCHEGAIGLIDGKARLLREDYCDGLGDCLPVCPTQAITFEEREAPAYDHAAVQAAKAAGETPRGCPGSAGRSLSPAPPSSEPGVSQLSQWPVQLKLVPVDAPYFNGAELLIAADCCAYAYGGFHQRFISGRITLIGCPKLDGGDYAEKLTEIFRRNDMKSVVVTRMEVPCCGGLESAVKRAVQASGKPLPLRVVVLGTDGRILRE